MSPVEVQGLSCTEEPQVSWVCGLQQALLLLLLLLLFHHRPSLLAGSSAQIYVKYFDQVLAMNTRAQEQPGHITLQVAQNRGSLDHLACLHLEKMMSRRNYSEILQIIST